MDRRLWPSQTNGPEQGDEVWPREHRQLRGASARFPESGGPRADTPFPAPRRNIAKVASQVHAFQENPYTFAPDPKLQSCLQQRIARFSGADVSVLAADGGASSQRAASDKHCRRIQDKLRRMRATFQ